MIYKNTVIQYNVSNSYIKGNIIRIIWLNDSHSKASYVAIGNSGSMPRFIDVQTLLSDLENNDARIINDPFSKVIQEESIPEKYKEIRDHHIKVIEYLWNSLEPGILYRQNRGKYIHEASEKLCIPEKTIINILLRYWQRGMNYNALLPDYQNSGAKGKQRSATEKKRGRSRRPTLKGDSVKGINVTEDIKKTISKAIGQFYKNNTERSLKEAYKLMLKTYFSDIVYTDGVLNNVIWENNSIPSFGQFYYWYRKEKDAADEYKNRHGENAYNLKQRPLLENSNSKVLGPGNVYQIDATVANVYLVSAINRKWIIGRPVVYDVMDVFSRLITGLYVGLEGPSWIGAMMALNNVITDKVEYCKQFNINISPSDWPNSLLPECILADRGEFEGYNTKNLINNLNIRVENTPPYRGDLKGIVERNFRTSDERITHLTPGAVQREYEKRKGHDYRLDAILTLKEFTSIILYEAIRHNKSIIEKYPREKGLVRDDILPKPIDLWEWGIKNRKGSFIIKDPDIVKLNLMPNATALITRQGISFSGLWYGCTEAVKENWFVNKNGTEIEIVYDPRCMSHVYILQQNGNSFIKCSMLEKSRTYMNSYFEDILFVQELEQDLIRGDEDTQNQVAVDFYTNVENIIDQAKSRTPIKVSESKRQRVKNIRSNRYEERNIIREEEKFELNCPEKNSTDIVVVPESNVSKLPSYDRMLNMIRERSGK